MSVPTLGCRKDGVGNAATCETDEARKEGNRSVMEVPSGNRTTLLFPAVQVKRTADGPSPAPPKGRTAEQGRTTRLPHDRVVDVRGDRLDSSRMFPPTTVVRYSALDVCWSPTRLDPLFKTYQGTAHAVPASAEAAHPARGRADTEQHGLLSIFDD